jgi:hypothetical protein
MKRLLPLSRSRSPRAHKRLRKRPLNGSGVIPSIFVRGRSSGTYGGYDYFRARIQIRREKYRYLVWYEGGRKREFYLGQVKTLPLRAAPAGLAGARASSGPGRPHAGVGK